LKVTGIISVFGSSSPRPGDAAYEDARTVGRLLAQAGYGVATGGYGGTMTAVSQGAAEAGGHVIGVASVRIETYRGASVNKWVKQVHKYESLSDRLLHLVTRNNGMIVLPGGIGTLSEMALAWSFLQVGEIEKRPLVLLGDMWRQAIRNYYLPEYVPEMHMDLLHFADSPEAAVAYVTSKLDQSE
jgi:uncharacterized protein (TIGR00730 family)